VTTHGPKPNQTDGGRRGAARRLWEWIERPGLGKWLFGSRSFGGGRVQVSGCSPGCLLLMAAISILLTLALNLVLDWME
jgi:hypothetical protein